MKQVQKISVAYHPDFPPPLDVIEQWKSIGVDVLLSKATTKYQVATGTRFYKLNTHQEVSDVIAEAVNEDLEPYKHILGGCNDSISPNSRKATKIMRLLSRKPSKRFLSRKKIREALLAS